MSDTIVGAGIALVTGIVVASLSAIFESRRAAAARAHALTVEESRRQHEATIRFHDERLAAYIEYMGAAQVFVSAATTWINHGGSESISTFLSRMGVVVPYTKAMTRITLLSKSDVNLKVHQIHSCMTRLIADDNTHESVRQTVTAAVEAFAAFETAAKAELEIS